jgi:hypothetical protein
MGYAFYTLPDGREAGYGVAATCDAPDCKTAIDRGLAYLCGTNPLGDEHGCTGYFCDEHLFYGGPSQLCEPCLDRWESLQEVGTDGS